MASRGKVFISLAVFLLAAGRLFAASYYRIPVGSDDIVNEWGVCKDVQNDCSADIFVPTNSSAEWGSFWTYPPGCVSFTSCAPSQTAYYARATAAVKACNSQTLAQGNTACQSEFGSNYSWAAGVGGYRNEATQAIKEVSGSYTASISLIQYYADNNDWFVSQMANSESAGAAGGGSMCSGSYKLQCIKNVYDFFDITPPAYLNDASGASISPRVAAAYDSVNEEYGLVWQNYATNDVYMRRITKYGVKSGGMKLIKDLSSEVQGLHIAFDSDNQRYFIVWQPGASPSSYYGVLVSTFGTVIRSEFPIATGLYNTYDTFRMTYETGHGQYIIINAEGTGPAYLHGAYYDASANIIGSSFTITAAGADTAALAFNTYNDRWSVVYKEWGGTIRSEIFAYNGTTRLNTNTCTNCAAYSIAANTANGQYLMAYNDASYVYTKTIGTTGAVGATALQINHNTGTVTYNPQVLYLPSENRFLVGWRNYYHYITPTNTQYAAGQGIAYEVGKAFWGISGGQGVFVPETGSTGGFAYFANTGDNTAIKVKIVSSDRTEY